jgi:excisionase family DNA binding protein
LRTQAARASETRQPLTEQEVLRAHELGRDLKLVWVAPSTTVRDRKRLLRAAIEEVQLSLDGDRHCVRVIWKGGAVTERHVPRPRLGDNLRPRATAQDVIDRVRKLATEFDDTQIARILHRQGCRSGIGLAFTKSSVAGLRHKHQIPACPKTPARDPREGPFTADEAASELGVSVHTVHRWLRDGVLPGQQLMPAAPWRIVLTDALRSRLTAGTAPDGWVGLEEAARQLGIGKSLAAHWVKQGKLRAVRTTVGNRQCWRIDVNSAKCAPQRTLLDPMISAHSRGDKV